MKKLSKYLIILGLSIAVYSSTHTQEKVEIEGAIQIGNSEDPTPDPGTIRWTGLNFEGWNGVTWVPFMSFYVASTITDQSGNQYPTVQIGSQEWMAENLRTNKYRNNDAIPNIPNGTDWGNLGSGAWCWYNNDTNYDKPYGKMYNWYAVNDGRGICPAGWHVPTDAEWTILSDYLGGLAVAGGKMKSQGTTYWTTPNVGASNESGFSGLPGGARATNGSFLILPIGPTGIWWTSTDPSPPSNNAMTRTLNSSGEDLVSNSIDKNAGFSVRCLKD